MSFPHTHWSLVQRAGAAPDFATRRKALGILLKRYLPAMRAHLLLGHHVPRDDVEDLLQSFVSDQIVEQNLIAHAEQRRGKFRSFLLLALNRHIARQIRHETTASRRPRGHRIESLNERTRAAAESEEPSQHFDRAWAKQLIDEALRQMENECRTCDRRATWIIFMDRIVMPLLEGAEPTPYEQLARELEIDTPRAAANLLITGKRMFARLLRSMVREYAHEHEVEDEIEELMQILVTHPRV